MSLTLRATLESDLPSLDRLFHSAFGHGFDAHTWAWKYRGLPGEGRSVVAINGAGEVVAHAGAIALWARTAIGDGWSWQLTDWAGAQVEHSLFPALVRLGRWFLADLPRPEGDVPWVYGFPSPRHLTLGERAFGYHALPEILPAIGQLPTEEGDGLLEVSDQPGPWAVEAWEACGVHGIERTEAFLAWRYYARPHRYYRFHRLRGRSGQAGCAVFAFVEREAMAAELWLPCPSGADSQTDLVSEWHAALLASAADLRTAGIESWRFWPAAQVGFESLVSHFGLETIDERLPMAYRGRVDAPDRGPLHTASGVTYAMGDSDLV